MLFRGMFLQHAVHVKALKEDSKTQPVIVSRQSLAGNRQEKSRETLMNPEAKTFTGIAKGCGDSLLVIALVLG